MYIDDVNGLRELVDQLKGSDFVAVDTEFMRERTYFARLCLIQIGNEDISAIIDPLAIDDLSLLGEILFDESILKVLHAGQQDLEIFYQLLGRVPAPIFDTQTAATLAGFQQQVGYGALVHDLSGVKLDKSDTFTDWAKRPLSSNQVEYALNDVRYLPGVYHGLKKSLVDADRMEWLTADFARMAREDSYRVDPDVMWRRLKRLKSLNRRQLGVLQKVTAWRELEAQRRDIPRKWVVGDESLIEIARRAPADRDALAAVRGVGDKLGKSSYTSLLQAVQTGLAIAEDDLPTLERKPRLHNDTEGAVDLMAALVRVRAKEHDVAVPLLASRAELDRLAAGEREGSALLEGWRRDIVGEELVELLDGELALSLQGGELSVRRIDGEAS